MRNKIENVRVLSVHDRGDLCDITLEGARAGGDIGEIQVALGPDHNQHPRLLQTLIWAALLDRRLGSVTVDDDGSGKLVISCVQTPTP